MSTRKSARIEAKHIAGGLPDITAANALSEEELYSPKTKSRSRKRKSTALDHARPIKKTRTRGFLQRVLDMPFDLLPEIFGHLNPLDLLNLSRTSKDLHKFLMNRSSRTIWLQTMVNAPEMVDCPSHISEPAWINYLFGKSCMGCGKNTQGIHTLERAFVRLCTKCMKQRFTEIKNLSTFAHSRVYPITVVVHNIIISLNGAWYLEPGRDARWTKEYQELTTEEEKAAWEVKITSETQDELTIVGECLRLWAKMQIRLDNEKLALVDERRKLIVDHIRTMGWGDEIDKMGDDIKTIDIPLITAACQKNVTARILGNMEARLKSTMETIKTQRLARELRVCHMQRLNAFAIRSTLPITLLSRREPQPRLRDVFENQRAKDLVFKTPPDVQLHESDFDFIEELLPEIVQEWRSRAASQLVAKIRKAMGVEHSIDTSTVLSLATSVFCCSESYDCYSQNLWLSDALAHPCCTPPSSKTDPGMDTEPTYLSFAKKPWSSDSLYFNKVVRNIIYLVVQLCGLDPLTTTIDQMNQLNPVFECRDCRKPQFARQVMSWQGVVQHMRRQHGYFTLNFDLEILEGDEAQDAKNRIAEAREKRIYTDELEILCMHCPYPGKMSSVRRHLMKQHNISKPAEGIDLMLSGKNPNLYQDYSVEMWPPYVSPDDDSDEEDNYDSDREEDEDGGCTCGQCFLDASDDSSDL